MDDYPQVTRVFTLDTPVSELTECFPAGANDNPAGSQLSARGADPDDNDDDGNVDDDEPPPPPYSDDDPEDEAAAAKAASAKRSARKGYTKETALASQAAWAQVSVPSQTHRSVRSTSRTKSARSGGQSAAV